MKYQMVCICGKTRVVDTADDSLSLHFPTHDRANVEYHHDDGTSCIRQFLPERGLGLRTTEYCPHCRGFEFVLWDGMPYDSPGRCLGCLAAVEPEDDYTIRFD